MNHDSRRSIERMAENGFRRFPWPRDTYSVLLRYLAKARPKAVAFDLLLLEDDRGPEVAHVTQQHTIRAIQKGKVVQMAAKDRTASSNPELFRRLTDEAYKIVFAGFGRADELDADAHGIGFAAGSGYAAGGLGAFLATLKVRNGSSNERQGLFASHPEMDERMQKLAAMAQSLSAEAGATLAERYSGNVKFQPVGLAEIATVEWGAAGLAGAPAKEEPKKKERFSLASLKNPTSTTEPSAQSAAVTGSGGSRGVDKERLAKGGPNPASVTVTLTEAEIHDFRTAGHLKTSGPVERASDVRCLLLHAHFKIPPTTQHHTSH